MPRARSALVTALFFGGLAVSRGAPVVQSTGVSPEPAVRLAAGQSLYVRVAYESAEPLRFQAAGYARGGREQQLAMNGSPAYPAGKGQAIVWLFGQPGARIDEVRVRVYDVHWKELFVVPVPVQAEWHAGVPAAPNAAWTAELLAAQNELATRDAREAALNAGLGQKLLGALSMLLVPIMFLAVPGYPLLQIYAVRRLDGPVRLLSALPLSFMVPVYAFCLYSLSRQSNLWPLPVLFASPLAFAITLTFWLVGRRQRRTRPSA